MKRIISAILAFAVMIPFFIFDSFAALTEKERENNEKYIYDFLKSELALNDAEACGVIANIYGESRFDPEAYCIDVDGYPSYGLCQWHVSRLTALYDFCEENDLDATSVEGQMQYLKHELNTTEKYAYSMILGIPNNADGAYTAGYNWSRYFGRGATSLYEHRGNLAKTKFWPKYGASSSQTVYATISAGTYYISNNSNGQYITVPSHREDNGTDVAVATGAENNYFKIIVKADTYGYTLKPKYTRNAVVNIYATLVQDGKNVTLYEPTGNNSQAWYFEAVEGGYVIRSVQKEELVLDISSSNSVIVKTYAANKSSQIWSLIPADTPDAVTPTVTAEGDLYTTVIEWPAAEHADMYTVTIIDTSSGNILFMESVNATKYEVQLDAGSYSVKIDSYNYQSNMSASGDSVAFTVPHIHVHDFSGRTETVIEPTCTEKGLQKIYCTGEGCNEYITVETETKPHDYKTVFSPPTPTTNGTIGKICMKCYQFTVVKDIPASGANDPVIAIENGEIIAGETAKIKISIRNFGSISGGTFRLDQNEKVTAASIQIAVGARNVSFNDGIISFEMKDGEASAEITLNISADEDASGKIYTSLGYNVDSFTYKNGNPAYPGVSGGTLTVIQPRDYYGDADGDGDVTFKDVLLMRRYIAGLIGDDEIDIVKADTDHNGSCDMKDVLRVRRVIAGLD